MPNLHALIPLLAQAERERDAARLDCQRADTAHQSAQSQAAQLLTYRREYEQRWGEQFCREGKIELVRCYQGFIERLNQAVEQQDHVQRHAAMRLEREREALQALEMRVASVRKLIERRTQEHRTEAQRREQKHSDELSSRTAWNRMQAAGPQFGA